MSSLKVDRLFGVQGKVVLITGGLTGIGLMMTQAFVENGATVVVSSRKVSQQQAAAIGGGGDKCISIAADLGTEAGCKFLASEFAKRFSKLDVLINNSGATWGEPFETHPDAAWDKILALNVKSIFFLTRSLLPQLKAAASDKSPARVINIGSIDGVRMTQTPHFAYSTSKAAVHHLTKVLATELAPHRITVNAIACGYFLTKMTAGLAKLAGEDVVESMAPLSRSGKAEDVAGAALLFASNAGAWVTGTVLPVDGGVLIKPQASL